MSSPEPAILVVDDEETNRYTLVRRLERAGYKNVATAENGRAALEALRAQPFDLVLLDIMMPEVDGYEVLRQAKADMRLRHVPVIMISAIDDIASVVKCIELGAEDYLPKPFNSVLLSARIGACLEKKRLRDQEAKHLEHVQAERKRSDNLLNVILPAEAVKELKTTGAVRPRRYEDVAVMFCDIVGFTAYCERHTPEEIVTRLQALVAAFEDISLAHGMEKIKTIGDAFMATAGLLRHVESPLLSSIRCGLDMARAVQQVVPDWRVRVGVHIGPVVAGIVGNRQYLFDLWGDTVNVASRLSDLGGGNTVTMTYGAWTGVQDVCEGRMLGAVDIKGKGRIDVVECYALRE
jgi:CheY-like chemotaxis protein